MHVQETPAPCSGTVCPGMHCSLLCRQQVYRFFDAAVLLESPVYGASHRFIHCDTLQQRSSYCHLAASHALLCMTYDMQSGSAVDLLAFVSAWPAWRAQLKCHSRTQGVKPTFVTAASGCSSSAGRPSFAACPTTVLTAERRRPPPRRTEETATSCGPLSKPPRAALRIAVSACACSSQ